MCTAILLIRPNHPWPIVLGSIRDERRTRPWKPPDRWWAQKYPGAIGGQDEMAGGTWLAVDPAQQRVAVLLNRLNQSQSLLPKRTRGVLPLETVAQGTLPLTTKADQFNPFNLLYASLEPCVWWRWDGKKLSKFNLKSGLYMLNSSDLNDIISSPRLCRWFPLFCQATPPECLDSSCSTIDWGDWPRLIADPDSPDDDPSALNVKGVSAHPDFGTVCATLLAFAADGRVRYDFCPTPPHQGSWQQII